MHQPLISIIITVLNGEKTIGQCLNSIQNQSFADYEVMIVDGGSTDQTVAVINASPLVNKKVYVESGLGLYAGLNTGVKLATGKWLYFIGCDDKLYSIDTLRKVAETITSENNRAKVIVGNVDCIKQENLLRPKLGSPYWMRYQVHHQGMFYDQSLFDNALYNEEMRIASDYEFNLTLALNKVPHQAINLTICSFGGDGVSENQVKRGFSEMQAVHKRLFSGIGRQWALAYYWLQQTIVVVRKRLGLVNIKNRLKRRFKRQTSFT